MSFSQKPNFKCFFARGLEEIWDKGPFTNYVDKILAFLDHLPYCVDFFMVWTLIKSGRDVFGPPIYLLTSSCKSSLWTTPQSTFQWQMVIGYLKELFQECQPSIANQACRSRGQCQHLRQKLSILRRLSLWKAHNSVRTRAIINRSWIITIHLSSTN